jgi:hypothetical protein
VTEDTGIKAITNMLLSILAPDSLLMITYFDVLAPLVLEI